MTDVNLILFGMPGDLSLIKEIERYYTGAKGISVQSTSSVEEAVELIRNTGNALFLFKIENKTDLTNAVAVLKTQRRLIKQGFLKSSCLAYVMNPKVEKILTKYGCADHLEPGITAKTLSFKIDFWARALATLIKNEEVNQELRKQKELANMSKDNKANDFIFGPALLLRSDIWILKSERDYKKIIKRWMVKFLGPSPNIGQWIELDRQPGDRDPTWRYVTKNEENIFILEDGAWFYYGDKPEFNWEEMRWTFTGDTPHLYFYSREGNVYSRIKYAKGKLLVTKNSEFALTKEPEIISSCEDSYEYQRIKKAQQESGQDNQDDEDIDFNNPQNLLNKLERKAQLEQEEDTDNRSSTNKDSKIGNIANLDDINQETGRRSLRDNDNPNDPFRSKKEVDQLERGGNLEGKSSTDKLEHNPLSGKGKTDHLDRSAYEGNSKTDNLGSNKKQEKLGVEELDRSPLSAKGGTDHLSSHQDQKGPTENLGSKHQSLNLKPEEYKPQSIRKQGKIEAYEGSIPKKKGIEAQEYSAPKKKLAVDELRRDRIEFEEEDQPSTKQKKSDHLGQYGPSKKMSVDELRRERIEFEEDETPSSRQDEYDHLGGRKKGKNLSVEELSRDKIRNDIDDDFEDAFDEQDDYDHLGLPKGRKMSIDELRRDSLNDLDDDFDEAFDEKDRQIQNPFGKKQSIDELERDSFDDVDDLDDAFEHVPRGLDENFKKDPQHDNLFEETSKNLPKQDLKSHASSMIGSLGEFENNKKNPNQLGKSKEDFLNSPLGSLDSPFGKKKNEASYQLDKEHPGHNNPNELPEIKKINDDTPVLKNSNEMPGAAPNFEKEEKENRMLELLDGGLTDGASKIQHDTNPFPKKDKNLEIINPSKNLLDNPEGEKVVEPIIKNDGVNLNLESGEVKVILKQESKSGNMLTFLCEFDDLFEDELMVSIPKNSVNKNGKLLINLSLRYDKKVVTVESAGKILDIEPSDDGPWDMLVIKLTNFNKDEVNELMELYAKRQESIHDFMKRAKGY